MLMHMHSMGRGKVKEAESIFISQLLNIRLHCLNISVTSAYIVQRSLVKSRRLKMKLKKRKSWAKKVERNEIEVENTRFAKKLGCL